MNIDKQALYEKRLRGYDRFIREELLLRREFNSNNEFELYLALLHCIVDWDPKHATVGNFHYVPEQIMYIYGWKKQLTDVTFRRLVKKGYIEVVDKPTKLYHLVAFEARFGYMKEKNHTIGDYISLIKAEVASKKTNLSIQNTAATIPSSPIYRDNIGSFKVEYGLIPRESSLSKEDQMTINKILEPITKFKDY